MAYTLIYQPSETNHQYELKQLLSDCRPYADEVYLQNISGEVIQPIFNWVLKSYFAHFV